MAAATRVSDFAIRPGFGEAGKAVRVRTNFFEATALPDANILHFDVTITPDVPPALNRKVFATFEEKFRATALGGIRTVFDGWLIILKKIILAEALNFSNRRVRNIISMIDNILTGKETYIIFHALIVNFFSSLKGRKNMFAPRTLPFGDAYTFNDDDSTGRRPPRSFKLKIVKVNEIVMEELHQFLDGTINITPNCLTGIMALDVLIRHRPSMMNTTVGRSFYTNRGSRPLFGGAEVWQGYYQSARPTLGRIIINIDVSATAFFEAGSLLEMVTKILGRRTPEDFRRGITERDSQKIERSLKGVKIRVMHRGDAASRRRYRIIGLTRTPANQTRFSVNDQPTDVAAYFNSAYQRRLNFAHLPCVIVGTRNTFLPLEVCQVIEIQARVLPTPFLEYHQNSREPSFQPKDGAWNLRDRKVATGATLGSWSVVVFCSENDCPARTVQGFIRELINTCQDTGMNIPNRNPPTIYAGLQGDTETDLKQAWLRAGNMAKSQPQLIVCVLPNTGVALYAEIKRVSDTVIGVATQCVQSKHVLSTKKQYCANVCLKMNVKLGGMNSYLGPNYLPFISDRPTILIGADVTHPPPGDTSRPSITALCGSMDAKASRYSASIRVQGTRTEIIVDLANMVKELLKTFYQTCGRKPERIIFYRDGVSEGQFRQVLKEEIGAVRAACLALDATYRPTITFVVVQKRHHTRFFPIDRRDADRTGNCLPGTVVDSNITHPTEFDFYLQSHAGLQGTSRPTHYHVLHDENNFNADTNPGASSFHSIFVNVYKQTCIYLNI
ncbi:4778_t:CDS:10 [Diversispora eburnea]|uniref:4778_t:CDS:1 n=1 Tax=Diversispora eburnea TaxID=1213867 RepID=A0A9N9CA20_9GLOM|nr:4778_t:CDS:10 [Diversispora eburnea]